MRRGRRASDRPQTQVDVATFIAWADADQRGEKELANFYMDRFRAEFKPAFEAWLATRPQENPSAPPTPFAMKEYQVTSRQESVKLDAAAEASAAVVSLDIQRASKYVLTRRCQDNDLGGIYLAGCRRSHVQVTSVSARRTIAKARPGVFHGRCARRPRCVGAAQSQSLPARAARSRPAAGEGRASGPTTRRGGTSQLARSRRAQPVPAGSA